MAEYKELVGALTHNLLAREDLTGERIAEVADAVLFGEVDDDDTAPMPDVSLAAAVAEELERYSMTHEVALLRDLAHAQAVKSLRAGEIGYAFARVVAWA